MWSTEDKMLLWNYIYKLCVFELVVENWYFVNLELENEITSRTWSSSKLNSKTKLNQQNNLRNRCGCEAKRNAYCD